MERKQQMVTKMEAPFVFLFGILVVCGSIQALMVEPKAADHIMKDISETVDHQDFHKDNENESNFIKAIISEANVQETDSSSNAKNDTKQAIANCTITSLRKGKRKQQNQNPVYAFSAELSNINMKTTLSKVVYTTTYSMIILLYT